MTAQEATGLLEPLFRYMAPALAAIITFVVLLNIAPVFGRERAHLSARLIGCLLAGFWLTAIGPHRLVHEGGVLMKLLGIQQPTVEMVMAFGLVWLAIGLVSLWLLRLHAVRERFVGYVLLGLAHAGIVACLGVFVFAAIVGNAQAPTVGGTAP